MRKVSRLGFFQLVFIVSPRMSHETQFFLDDYSKSRWCHIAPAVLNFRRQNMFPPSGHKRHHFRAVLLPFNCGTHQRVLCYHPLLFVLFVGCLYIYSWKYFYGHTADIMWKSTLINAEKMDNTSKNHNPGFYFIGESKEEGGSQSILLHKGHVVW